MHGSHENAQEIAMKAQERKALEQNAIVETIEQAYEGVKQGPPSTMLYWVVGIGLVALVVGLFYYFISTSNSIDSSRWATLGDVAFPAQLDPLLEKAEWKDTTQGRLASFKQARLDLAQGIRDLGLDRKTGIEKIKAAAERYEGLRKTSARVPLLQQEALWGAAKAREALGENAAAKAHYEQLVRDFKTTALGEDAAKQIKRLDDPANAKDFADVRAKFGPLAGP